ncbi:hypothetical protein NE865_15499 [Phthorimaea operculella]|nr:hypothetical protein NE865_15499 [Phthorimaea operculella]
MRAILKEKLSVAYDLYVDSVVAKIRENPRAFWQHINSLKSTGGFEPRVTYKGVPHEGSQLAYAFADFFSSVFLPDTPDLDSAQIIQNSKTSSSNYIHIDNITDTDISSALDKLKPRSAVGPDGVPAYLLKACKNQLLDPIKYIFNLTLKTSQYPEIWKVS